MSPYLHSIPASSQPVHPPPAPSSLPSSPTPSLPSSPTLLPDSHSPSPPSLPSPYPSLLPIPYNNSTTFTTSQMEVWFEGRGRKERAGGGREEEEREWRRRRRCEAVPWYSLSRTVEGLGGAVRISAWRSDWQTTGKLSS